jgi:hypothetical protein
MKALYVLVLITLACEASAFSFGLQTRETKHALWKRTRSVFEVALNAYDNRDWLAAIPNVGITTAAKRQVIEGVLGVAIEACVPCRLALRFVDPTMQDKLVDILMQASLQTNMSLHISSVFRLLEHRFMADTCPVVPSPNPFFCKGFEQT